jgi:hypothetical protein
MEDLSNIEGRLKSSLISRIAVVLLAKPTMKKGQGSSSVTSSFRKSFLSAFKRSSTSEASQTALSVAFSVSPGGHQGQSHNLSQNQLRYRE